MIRKKLHIKPNWKEMIVIVFSWLVAAMLAYLVYLKIKFLQQ
jgi:hypothetical protein